MNGRITVGRKDTVAITARELIDALAELRRRFGKSEVGPTAVKPHTDVHPGEIVTGTVCTDGGTIVTGRLINVTFELAEQEDDPPKARRAGP